jgi:hypothetical protein
MMNKAKITLDLLMDNAAAYFINFKNMGNWKTEISRNTQIIVLTTQISKLETKVSQLSGFRAPMGPSTMTPKAVLELATTVLNFGISRKLTAKQSTA